MANKERNDLIEEHQANKQGSRKVSDIIQLGQGEEGETVTFREKYGTILFNVFVG